MINLRFLVVDLVEVVEVLPLGLPLPLPLPLFVDLPLEIEDLPFLLTLSSLLLTLSTSFKLVSSSSSLSGFSFSTDFLFTPDDLLRVLGGGGGEGEPITWFLLSPSPSSKSSTSDKLLSAWEFGDGDLLPLSKALGNHKSMYSFSWGKSNGSTLFKKSSSNAS